MIIEELAPEHFGTVARWVSNPEINRWLSAEWRNKETTSTLLAIAARNRRNRLFLVRYEDRPCGFVGLADIDAMDKTGMVWYFLGEQMLAGRGIISEAVRQLVRLAFLDLGLKSLYAWIMEDNPASGKVLLNAGFKEAGRISSSACSAGRQVDRIYFDIVCKDEVERARD